MWTARQIPVFPGEREMSGNEEQMKEEILDDTTRKDSLVLAHRRTAGIDIR
jgi:hypothetical protein